MVSNEIMRNSDVFMRISHFLMKTRETQVIGLIIIRSLVQNLVVTLTMKEALK